MTHEPATTLAPTDAPVPQALWVGDWLVAASLNQIARGEQVIRLEPKAMAVLLHLASRPQQVVSRDDLLCAVWPGVVVGDNALTQVVIKLRKALGDTAREPAYVQAIAKKGYRLIAEVRPAVPADSEGAAVARPAPRPRPFSARWVAPVLVALLLAVSAAWILGPAKLHAPPRRDDALQPAAPALVVEPFRDLNSESDSGLIARAITADLITDLSKVSGLWVVGAAQPLADNGRRPRYVLSGTVQQQGERLRLNVLLTDAEANRQLWSERFDRDVPQLFDVQDNLVTRILDVLQVKVSEAEALRLAQRSTRNLGAYEKFVQAQAALLVRRPAQNETARGLYWDAIGLDPAFARAYAGLAMTCALKYQQGWTKDGDNSLDRANEFAHTALQMRPDMPEAHWVLAFVSTQRRQFDAALRDLDEALQLSPSYADGYALKAGIYTYLGKPAPGVALMQKALQLNPDAGSLYLLLLGRAYYFLGDIEQARFNLKRTLERNPENLEARIYLAAADWQAGDRAAALWQVSEIRSLERGFRADAWLANYPLTDAGERRQLQTAMIEVGL